MVRFISIIIKIFTADNLPYEKDTPFEIPDSWQWIKHNDIFEISGGSQPPKSKFRNEKLENYIRLYQIRDYGENPVPVYIPISTASKRTKKGDILLARYGASLGKVFWAEDGAYNVAMAKVIPIYSCVNEIIDKEYLFYYYHTDLYRSVIFNNSRSAQAGFNKEDLDNMWFPLPPKEEQRRIVLALNNVLPYIEEYSLAERKLIGYNKEFPEKLKKSILQEAVQGKLVPQDENDEAASVLLERIRTEKTRLVKEGKIKKDKHESVIFRRDNSHYEKRGSEVICIDDEIPFYIPISWSWCRVSSIGTIIRGSGIKRTETVDDGYPCIRYGEIYTSYNLQFKSSKSFVPKELFNKCKHIKQNDIVFTLTGENKPDIAKAVAYTGEKEIAAGGDLAFWTNHQMNPLYLMLVLNSPYAIAQKISLATGDIIIHISGEKVGSILLPIPPISEQQRIVDRVFRMLDFIDSI